ncbi:uncharacterized protein LOC121374431 [Gigantopelta aegis]|uniref:uncharacterized protein LOC121374431 n=1 Tax=Gigantopelta aegis TaxID=1735272 RepID=UPI001B88D8DF|nr:uncharacterized protein LOC121374431 [Gigantopelta aegis]
MESSDCDITVEPEGIAGPRECSYHSESPIDKCNLTGRWLYHDEKVNTACSRFFEPVKRGDYKNIFCYVCNTDNIWSWLMIETLGKDPAGLPLTALLDFDDSDIPKMESQQECPNEHFFDSYNSICRQILCPLGKVFKDEECKSLIADFIYGYYIICMDVTMQIPLSKTSKITPYIFRAIDELKRDIISRFNLSYAIKKAHAVHIECINDTVTVAYTMQLRVYSSNALRDDLEKNLSDYFRKNLFSEVYFVDNQTVEFSINDNTCSTWYSASVINFVMCNGRLMLFGSMEDGQPDFIRHYADLMVNDMLWCAQVELNSTEYSVEDNSSIIVIEATNRTLTQSEYQLTDSGTVKACLFDFQRNQTVLPPNISSTISGLLSMICTSISLAFLIISVMVYIVIPDLRTDVSRNNICLALNLIAAQTFFISPSIIVTITALSNYFMSGFSGYGHGICYLSNASSRVYGLAIPVGILVCANIVLFIYTIITICRLPKLKSTSNNKVSMIMCVNLSTITGAAWVFGYAYEATGFIGFAYAFSVFLGSIGLFLFMSFFANKFKESLRENVLCTCCTCCTKSVTSEVPLPADNTAVTRSSDSSDLTKQ